MRFLMLLVALGVLAVVAFFVVLIPVVIAITAAVGLAMPWLAIGFLIWACCAVCGRRSQPRLAQRHWRFQSPPISVPQANRPWPRPQPVLPPKAELPIGVQVKVEQIRRKVDVLLGFASRFPPFSKDLYIVRQTATEYLPRTIDAYLALPVGQGNRPVTVDGKTALQELKEQLDLLDRKLDDITEDLQRQDFDRLLANRRFLEDRFGRSSS